jgi:hypothetical protein
LDTEHLLFPNKGGRFRFPFAAMKVGDFFFLTMAESAHSAWVSANHHAKTNPGKRFAKTREDNGWWRIVRVA